MSFCLGPFQVFWTIKSASQVVGYWLITFPSRSAADKHWRAVQKAMHNEPDKVPQHPVVRYHPQYLQVDAYWVWLPSVQTEAKGCISQGYGQELPSMTLSFNQSHEQRPDNANNQAYYIRSMVRPNLFWYYSPAKRAVEISSQSQTKFTIRRRIPLSFECRSEDDILISEDEINIFVMAPEWEDNVPDVMIVGSPSKLLVAASTPINDGEIARVAEAGVFKFGMFDGGFGVLQKGPWDGQPVFVSAKINGGERWEFI